MNPMLFPDERGNPLLAAGEYINEAAGRRRAEREARREEIGNRLLQTWPAEAARAAYEGVTLFGDVYAGRVDPMSDEAIGRAAELTGLLALQAPLASRQGTVGIFGGRGARTADLDALARAQSMADSGADRRAIWDATGWFRGPDGLWRFEIDDSGAQFGGLPPRREPTTLDAAMPHDELFRAYPDTARIETYGEPTLRNQARYMGGEGEMVAVGTVRDPRSSLLHETQHAIQAREGFARGDSGIMLKGGTPAWDIYQQRVEAILTPKSLDEYVRDAGFSSVDEAMPSYQEYVANLERQRKRGLDPVLDRAAQEGAVQDAYRRAAGEVEARNVQTRRDMTAAERRATPPWETQDVPDDMQIVIRR